MKLHPIMRTFVIHGVSILFSAAALAEPPISLGEFESYEQGKSVGTLAATRQAVFLGTDDPVIRAERERELLAFIDSDANPQAKAIAIEWLGSIGSAASVPGLVAARKIPALSAPVAAALERIPGPEAEQARLPEAITPLAVSSAATEVAAFSSALDKDSRSPAADALIASAMRSPNDHLAGETLRRIRAGGGSQALSALLIEGLAQIPQARQGLLCDALATRPGSAKELRAALIARAQTGDCAAILTLGRILQPADLEIMLGLAAGTNPPELSTAAVTALRRGINPDINPALRNIAKNGGTRAIAAVEALVDRDAAEAVPDLWRLAAGQDADVSKAAHKALGSLIMPGELHDLIKKLVAADGTPQAEALGQITWNVVRRHPDPAAAADLLEKTSTHAPPATKDLLLRYAARIRPKDAPKTENL